MDRGQVGGCCFGRLFLHAAGSIRAVEVVAGGRDLGVHIKAGGVSAMIRLAQKVENKYRGKYPRYDHPHDDP